MQRFASVVLVDSRGWVLLQERDEHPAIDPEKWGFVGGHLDPGEDYLAGAYRELAEETGVRLEDGLELFGQFTVHHDHTDSDDEFRLYVMCTELTDDDVECARRAPDRLRGPRPRGRAGPDGRGPDRARRVPALRAVQPHDRMSRARQPSVAVYEP